MHVQTYSRFLRFCATLAATALVAGCATVQPEKPEDAVQTRAQERVKLLQARDFTKAYQYLAPSYRALNDIESYRKSFGGGAEWIEPAVARVHCPEADRCIAEVKLGVLVMARGFGGKPLPTSIREIWIREGNQWWFQQYSNN